MENLNWDHAAQHFDVPHVMLTEQERENVVAAYYAGHAAGRVAAQADWQLVADGFERERNAARAEVERLLGRPTR